MASSYFASLLVAWICIATPCSHFHKVEASATRGFPFSTSDQGQSQVVEGCGQTSSCLVTSGCQLLTVQRESSLFSILQFRYSIEHVTALVEEFQYSLWELVGKVHSAWRHWGEFGLSVPVNGRGLLTLYPTATNTSSLGLSHLTSKTRVLRELRWWLTSVESHIQVLASSGMIRQDTGRDLVEEAQFVSRSFNNLLSVFDVEPASLPEMALCVQTPNELRNSEITVKAQYTSMVLRDTHRALAHIYDVLSQCEVESHHTGRHRVKLQCEVANNSIFYSSVPMNIDFLYPVSSMMPENE